MKKFAFSDIKSLWNIYIYIYIYIYIFIYLFIYNARQGILHHLVLHHVGRDYSEEYRLDVVYKSNVNQQTSYTSRFFFLSLASIRYGVANRIW